LTAPLRILQLVGSPTNAISCDLSELYARGSLEALHDPRRYAFVIAHVSPDGTWRFPASLAPEAIAAAAPLTLSAAVARIATSAIDVAVPQMFCVAGMTDMRALLDVLAIPYAGNRPLTMGLAANKAMAKAVVSAAGVDVPRSQLVRQGERVVLSVPFVVKPNTADNSDGVVLVWDDHAVADALHAAFAFADEVLVEDYVPLGREVRCAVVARDGTLFCPPLEEYFVDARTRPIRRTVDKLKRDDRGDLTLAAKTRSESWIVAGDDPIAPAVQDAARRCYTALGSRHYNLFDFRIDPQGRPWFLESGPYCSFSPQSVIVTMMRAAGIPLERFFADTIGDVLGERRGAMR
jgi:D-alanine-D-alanine ligase